MSTQSSVSRISFFSGFLLLSILNPLRAQNFSGKTVVSVQYEPADQPLDARDLATMQLVRPGQPLNLSQVATSIDRMFASGMYEDIQVDAEPSGGGVTIRFLTRPRRFVGHVGVAGSLKAPPNRAVIISDSQLQLGAPFDEDTLATARKAIEDELRNNGLYEATVGTATIEDPVTHQMTIRFLVQAGKR